MTRRPLVVVAVSLLASAVLLSGCKSYPPGPAGRVVGKDRHYRAAIKQWRFELTVRTADGRRAAFRVKKRDYDDCYRGSAYPGCTRR